MIIYLKKFGTTLNSRQFGKEALAAFKPSLENVKENEEIIVDFKGVITFTPSWGDEFLNFLRIKYKDRLFLRNTSNPSVQASLKLLEEIYKEKFRIERNKKTKEDFPSVALVVKRK